MKINSFGSLNICNGVFAFGPSEELPSPEADFPDLVEWHAHVSRKVRLRQIARTHRDTTEPLRIERPERQYFLAAQTSLYYSR